MNVVSPPSGAKILPKILAIIVCGVIGYLSYPYIQPLLLEEVVDIDEKALNSELKEQEVASLVVKENTPQVEKESSSDYRVANTASEGELATERPAFKEAIVEKSEEVTSQVDDDPLPSLLLVGTQATSLAARAKDEALLEKAANEGRWKRYREILHTSIELEFPKISLGKETKRYVNVWKEVHYNQAVLRWNVLGLFSQETLKLTSELPNSATFMSWLMLNDSAMEEMLLTLNEHDDSAAVLKFLCGVWGKYEKSPELASKYFNLALACAVVFDEKLPYTNGESYRAHVEGLERFLWYVEKNEKGLTEVSIDRSSARDLTFVVCSPVSDGELDWALKKFRSLRRDSFGNNYGKVKYLMERAVEGLNPYEEYTLPEILKEGGICGDQSYFCVNSARAAGIPAFILGGETSLGGHAWAAIKTEPDAWTTQVGRIGGVSQGRGSDPQGGAGISEQEVWLWSTKEHQSRSNLVKVNRLLWLADSIDSGKLDEEASSMVKVAHKLGPKFPHVWKKVYQVMLNEGEYKDEPSDPKTVKLWTKFAKNLKLEFKRNPRMASLAVEVEDKHVFPYADLNYARREMARARRRNDRDSKEQADLITTSLKRESQLLMLRDKDNAFREIGQLYDRALRDFGGSVSGFRTMAKDYFGMMKHDPKNAEKAVDDIANAFNRVVATGTKDWFRAKAEIDLHKIICQMYREIGEEKRAKNMEARLARMMKRAKRNAL